MTQIVFELFWLGLTETVVKQILQSTDIVLKLINARQTVPLK